MNADKEKMNGNTSGPLERLQYKRFIFSEFL